MYCQHSHPTGNTCYFTEIPFLNYFVPLHIPVLFPPILCYLCYVVTSYLAKYLWSVDIWITPKRCIFHQMVYTCLKQTYRSTPILRIGLKGKLLIWYVKCLDTCVLKPLAFFGNFLLLPLKPICASFFGKNNSVAKRHCWHICELVADFQWQKRFVKWG